MIFSISTLINFLGDIFAYASGAAVAIIILTYFLFPLPWLSSEKGGEIFSGEVEMIKKIRPWVYEVRLVRKYKEYFFTASGQKVDKEIAYINFVYFRNKKKIPPIGSYIDAKTVNHFHYLSRSSFNWVEKWEYGLSNDQIEKSYRKAKN